MHCGEFEPPYKGLMLPSLISARFCKPGQDLSAQALSGDKGWCHPPHRRDASSSHAYSRLDHQAGEGG